MKVCKTGISHLLVMGFYIHVIKSYLTGSLESKTYAFDISRCLAGFASSKGGPTLLVQEDGWLPLESTLRLKYIYSITTGNIYTRN